MGFNVLVFLFGVLHFVPEKQLYDPLYYIRPLTFRTCLLKIYQYLTMLVCRSCSELFAETSTSQFAISYQFSYQLERFYLAKEETCICERKFIRNINCFTLSFLIKVDFHHIN